MRASVVSLACVLALASSAGAPSATFRRGTMTVPAKAVVFTASYKGTATTAVNGSAVTVAARGSGKGTLVGASKIAGKGSGTTQDQCAYVAGLGTITSAKGTLKFKVLPGFSGCAINNDPNEISVSGTAKVVGGTKAFKKARGRLNFTGRLHRANGEFTIRLKGRLTV